jgi:hypothetical protein
VLIHVFGHLGIRYHVIPIVAKKAGFFSGETFVFVQWPSALGKILVWKLHSSTKKIRPWDKFTSSSWTLKAYGHFTSQIAFPTGVWWSDRTRLLREQYFTRNGYYMSRDYFYHIRNTMLIYIQMYSYYWARRRRRCWDTTDAAAEPVHSGVRRWQFFWGSLGILDNIIFSRGTHCLLG